MSHREYRPVRQTFLGFAKKARGARIVPTVPGYAVAGRIDRLDVLRRGHSRIRMIRPRLAPTPGKLFKVDRFSNRKPGTSGIDP
jgi:hypothetical protein